MTLRDLREHCIEWMGPINTTISRRYTPCMELIAATVIALNNMGFHLYLIDRETRAGEQAAKCYQSWVRHSSKGFRKTGWNGNAWNK